MNAGSLGVHAVGKQSRERNRRRQVNAANPPATTPYPTFKTKVDRDKLAPAGIPGDLILVARKQGDDAQSVPDDLSERVFSVWCAFSRGHEFPPEFSFDGPDTGESFFRFAPNVVNSKVLAGGCEFSLHANVRNEIAGTSAELRGTSAKEVRSRFLALGGHLKTGHGWTGQNRPPGERPRLVISIPRLPRDANRAGPWCASCAGRT